MLAELLAADDRISDSVAIEEAVWIREDAYPTGFGHGFAMPHCKSPSVRANSIALLRLNQAVEWGSIDDAPVDVVILLAVREADHRKEHMRVFSRLSRLVLREEFRHALMSTTDPAAICQVLQQQLAPAA
ncbi:MAG TPA: PTS sugar transporter subunit IIA [Opitutus sp.]|nr:PTS sugar transporter subunit IIA [Opitutus sp.]